MSVLLRAGLQELPKFKLLLEGAQIADQFLNRLVTCRPRLLQRLANDSLQLNRHRRVHVG